jgi:predicted transcriptional regulator
MAELKIVKTNEKVIIWLHRGNKSQQWLSEQLGQTRQAISQKIKENYFSVGDLIRMKSLGFDME